ncbi:NADPH-dependent FMN reductase [Streptomyces mirabilis]|uniref:NADPH-dependent FMN reductase n=1 Tax=Streptomyces mirabilis TaxID=68239 RepID=UPI0036D89D4F
MCVAVEGAADAGADSQVIDLKRLDLPFYTSEHGIPPSARRLADTVQAADARDRRPGCPSCRQAIDVFPAKRRPNWRCPAGREPVSVRTWCAQEHSCRRWCCHVPTRTPRNDDGCSRRSARPAIHLHRSPASPSWWCRPVSNSRPRCNAVPPPADGRSYGWPRDACALHAALPGEEGVPFFGLGCGGAQQGAVRISTG